MTLTLLPLEMVDSIFKDLSNKDVGKAHQVCKEWGEFLGNMSALIWNRIRFNEAGLPMVKGIDTKLNVVFNNLFTRSLDYEFFKKCHGEVRDIGVMSKEAYDMLFETTRSLPKNRKRKFVKHLG